MITYVVAIATVAYLVIIGGCNTSSKSSLKSPSNGEICVNDPNCAEQKETITKVNPCSHLEKTDDFLVKLREQNAPFVRKHYKHPNSISPDTLIGALLMEESQIVLSIEGDILREASGALRNAWKFKEERFNILLRDIFLAISANESLWEFPVDLTPLDLFHGHLFCFKSTSNTDLGILFHSKEYPRDLEFVNQNFGRGEHSPFTTSDLGFTHRNFVWIASTGKIYNIDGMHPYINPRYFVPSEWEDASTVDPELKYYRDLMVQSRTFQLERLSSIARLGDINYFFDGEKETLFLTYKP